MIKYSSERWKGKLTWLPVVVENVVSAAESDRAAENARGVVTWIDVEVKDRLIEAYDDEQAKSQQASSAVNPKAFVFTSFNLGVNLDGEVSIEGYGDAGGRPIPISSSNHGSQTSPDL